MATATTKGVLTTPSGGNSPTGQLPSALKQPSATGSLTGGRLRSSSAGFPKVPSFQEAHVSIGSSPTRVYPQHYPHQYHGGYFSDGGSLFATRTRKSFGSSTLGARGAGGGGYLSDGAITASRRRAAATQGSQRRMSLIGAAARGRLSNANSRSDLEQLHHLDKLQRIKAHQAALEAGTHLKSHRSTSRGVAASPQPPEAAELAYDDSEGPKTSPKSPTSGSLSRFPISRSGYASVEDLHQQSDAATTSDEESGPMPWGTIVRDLAYLAAPASISLMMSFIAGAITISYVGTMLGPQELAGASVGLFTINILLYPLMGLAYAVDTLSSQEFGRNPDGSNTAIGLIAQRGLVVNFCALVPVFVILFFRDSLLSEFYPKQLAQHASQFLSCGYVYLFGATSTTVMSKYLSNIRLPHLVTCSLCTLLVVLPLAMRTLIPLYGMEGAMLGMGLGSLVQLFVISVLTFWNHTSRAMWGEWRIGTVLSDIPALNDYLDLALPSCLFVALESSAFDVSALLAGSLSDVDGAAWSVVLNVLLILVSIPGGFVVASTACVGASVGDGRPQDARRYAIAAVCLAASCAVANDIIFFTNFDRLLRLFTSESAIIQRAHTIKYIAMAMHLLDSCQWQFQGIFSGAGKNDQGALILLGSLWLVGIPAAAMAPHMLHLGKTVAVCGVVGGLTVGLCVELPTMIIAVARWDWQQICDDIELEIEEELIQEEQEILSVGGGGGCEGGDDHQLKLYRRGVTERSELLQSGRDYGTLV